MTMTETIEMDGDLATVAVDKPYIHTLLDKLTYHVPSKGTCLSTLQNFHSIKYKVEFPYHYFNI